jgi:hypothetical protein
MEAMVRSAHTSSAGVLRARAKNSAEAMQRHSRTQTIFLGFKNDITKLISCSWGMGIKP